MVSKAVEILFNFKGMELLDAKTKKITTNSKVLKGVFGEINTEIKKITTNPFKEIKENIIESGKYLGNLTGITDKLTASNLHVPFQAMFKSMKVVRESGFSLFQTLKFGVMNFGVAATSVFGGLMPFVTAFAGALLTALGPITLIIAAIFLLKKAWDNNLGGIQTAFASVFGYIKDVWGRFSVDINKFMRDISPVFKPIVFLLKTFAKISLAPLVIALKIIGVTLRIVGQAIKFIVFLWKKAIDGFMKLSFVQNIFSAINTTLQKMYNFIKPIIDAIKMMIKLATSFADTATGTHSGNYERRITPMVTPAVGSQQRTVNNNNNITFNAASTVTPQNMNRYSDIMAASFLQSSRSS